MEMLLLFGCVLGLVLLNVPIAVALGVVAIAAIWLVQGTAALPNLPIVVYNAATNFPLLAIPLFILAGAIMNARHLVAPDRVRDRAARVHPRRAGDGVDRRVAVLRRDLRSAVADVAALGSITISGDEEEGLPARARRLRDVLGSDAGGDHPAVDPDDPLRSDGRGLGRATVRRRIVPGIIGGLGLMAMAYWFARRYDLPIEQTFRWSEVRRTAREALWAFTLPMIILGGIFGGVVTATERGAGGRRGAVHRPGRLSRARPRPPAPR